MAKDNSAPEYALSTTHTVFLDTNLDTHLAMVVSDEDTVRDLKNKIMIEHPRIFPNIGKITIHTLKVRRKACFYHLSDSMLVKSAFNGVNRSWFLHVDAASSQVGPTENRLYVKPGASNLPEGFCITDGPSAETARNSLQHDHPSKRASILDDSSLPQVGSSDVVNQLVPSDDQFGSGKMGGEMSKGLNLGLKHVSDEHHKSSSSDTSKRSDSEVLKKRDLVSQANEVLGTQTEHKKEKSKKRIRDMQCDGILGEALQPGPVAKKKRKNVKKNEDAICYPVDDPLKPNDAETIVSSKETSKPENMLPENSLEDKQKLTNATSDGLLSTPLEDDQSFPPSLVHGKRKKKKNSSSLHDEVDSAVPSSGKNVRRESSKVALGNSHKDLGKESDAGITPEETVGSATFTNLSAISEKEKQCVSVQEVGENMTPCSLGGPHGVLAAKADIGDVDADSLVAMDMCESETGGSKVDSERAATDQAVAIEGGRAKRSKKLQAGSAKGLNLPLVDEPDNLTRDITPSGYEDGGRGDDTIDTDLTDKIKKEKKALLQNGDLKIMSSVATISKCKSLGQDEAEMNIKDGAVSSNLLDASGIVKAREPSGKIRKKSKKIRASGAKSRLSSLGVEQCNSAGDVVPLRPEPDKAFDSDHPGDETKEEDSILSQTEKAKVSKVEDGGPGNDNIGTDKAEKEEKALSQDGDPKIVSSKAINSKCKSFIRHEAETDIKDGVVSSKILNASSIIEARDPSDKTRKKSKKTKTSDAKCHVSSSGVEHADSAKYVIPLRSEPDKAFDSDHPGDETKKEDNILSQTGKTKLSKMKSLNDPLLGCDTEADKGSENEAESLQLTQITRGQETVDYSDDKVKRKSIWTQSSTSKSLPDPPIKQKVVGSGGPTPSNEEDNKEENAPSKKMKKSKLGKRIPKNQLSDTMPEMGKDCGIRTESSLQYQMSGNIESSQFPSDTLECNVEGRPPEANFNYDDSLVNGCTGEVNNHMEVPTFDSDEVNFIHYFLPKQDQQEVVAPTKELVGKEIQVKKSDKEPKANKKTKKLKVHSRGTSPDSPKSLNSNENQGHKKKPRSGTHDTIQLQGPLSKDEQSEPASQRNRKASIIARDGVKASTSHDHDKVEAFSNEVSRTNIVNASGNVNASSKGNSADWDASSSSTESSGDRIDENKGRRELQSRSNHYRVAVKKPYGKKMGEVLNSSNHEKSLLTTSNTIFMDSITESSEDEGEVNNSDASTKSPDTSSSSDYSEGEPRVNLGSPGNGFFGGKRMGNGGNNITKSQSVGPKNITLDMILRSSSSYKKAKLTASQSQPEDTESQPIDFVL